MKRINKRANFDIQSFLVTLVLFIGIVVTFGTFAVEMSDDYNALTGDTIDPAFKETYNQLDTLEGKTDEIESLVLDTETGTKDAATDFFGDALNTLKLIGTSLSTTKTLMLDMAITLGIDAFWFRILQTVLILMLLTVLIFMIFRYR